jgi:iron complex outermembrane recepter protein
MNASTLERTAPRGRPLLRQAVAALLAGACTLPAAAPYQALAREVDASLQVEEIVVTARRRDESLLDVPLAVSAISGVELEQQGFQDIVAIAQVVPNLTLEVTRGTNTTLTAFIRGVGQQDPVAGFESGVGLYIDDVYLNRPQAAVLDIYDVERIEVLRGPQGTLYGRNTIGGAIKYVSKRLAAAPELSLRGTAGTDSELDLVVTGSTPIGDTLRVGASVATFNRNGFGDNLNLKGVENYNKEVLAGRLSVEYAPTDELFFRLSGDIVEDRSDPRQGHRLIPGQLSGTPVLSNVFDTQAALDNPHQKVEAKGVALNAEWQVSDTVKLKNILAYREDESHSPIDFDSLPAVDLDVPVVYTNDQFSEELQMLYEGERLAGIVGVYYLDANAFNAFDVILGTTGDLIGLPGLNAFTLGDVDTETWSVFGDFTYDLTDRWSLSVGGRYTSDKRSSRILRQTMIGGTSSYFGGTAVPIATTSDFDGSETFDEFTPRASISFKPTRAHNVYLTYSEGFKGGGFDPRGQSTVAPDLNGNGQVDAQDVFEFLKFEPETVETWELGWKASLLDDRVGFALAAFMSNYKNVQIPGSVGLDTDGDGVSDTFVGVTSNAGDADINGVELEGRARLANNLGGSGGLVDFAWSVGYLDATYNEFIDAFGNDVADQRVFQNTPEWTASGTLTLGLPLSLFGAGGEIRFINTVSYRDKASQFETPNPYLDQPAFTLWDASLVWDSDDGAWQAGIHAKNLTDEEYIVAGYNFVSINEATGAVTPTLGREGTLTAFYGNPRQVLATLVRRF